MKIYPELDEAFNSAKKKMELAVEDEVSSRLSSFFWQFTVDDSDRPVVRAWNEDGDEISAPISAIAKRCADGVDANHPDDKWEMAEAIAVSKSLRLAADQIDAALAAKA